MTLSTRSTALQVPGEAVTLRSPWAQKETRQPRDEGFALHPGGLHTPLQIPQEAATAPGAESPLLCGELSPVCWDRSHICCTRMELWLVPRKMKG